MLITNKVNDFIFRFEEINRYRLDEFGVDSSKYDRLAKKRLVKNRWYERLVKTRWYDNLAVLLNIWFTREVIMWDHGLVKISKTYLTHLNCLCDCLQDSWYKHHISLWRRDDSILNHLYTWIGNKLVSSTLNDAADWWYSVWKVYQCSSEDI